MRLECGRWGAVASKIRRRPGCPRLRASSNENLGTSGGRRVSTTASAYREVQHLVDFYKCGVGEGALGSWHALCNDGHFVATRRVVVVRPASLNPCIQEARLS
jgi:hypothetical protein